MINLNNYNVFIFDCDGVILDSNEIKTKAFQESLSGEPENLIYDFIDYHKKNGGHSRYKKFKFYFNNLKKQTNSDKSIKIALNNFASIVSRKLVVCSFIPGVLELIKHLFYLKKRLFVLSGSDQAELIQVFNKRNIGYYFEKIYGSPKTKLDNAKILSKNISNNEKVIFFGDSKSDFITAKNFGYDFVFVSGKSEWENGEILIKKNDYISINDFTSFLLK